MYKFIWRKLKLLKVINRLPPDNEEIIQPSNTHSLISKNLQENLEQINVIFHHSPDVVIRKFLIGRIEAMIVSLQGMSEYQLINEGILGSLMREVGNHEPVKEITVEYLKNSAINLNGVNETTNMDEAVEAVLKGNSAVDNISRRIYRLYRDIVDFPDDLSDFLYVAVHSDRQFLNGL